MFSNHEIVPVVMFHSVGLEDSDWIFSHISEPVNIFEEKISILREHGYNFVFWPELYAHMAGINRLPAKSIMLTFDDGYLDNWVYVFPILKKYDAKATIFVNPEFVDPGTVVRPTSEDASNGSVAVEQLQIKGFLNWEEMRKMQESGLVDIQSHSLTHTWYYSSDRLIDFHYPNQKKYPWMAWNFCKERKPFYMVEDQSRLVPFGMPVYEYEKALLCKRVFPPDDLISETLKKIEALGGKEFFKQVGWRDELKKFYNSLHQKHKNRFKKEDEAQYKRRIYEELYESKRIITEQLGKPVDFICWPGGGYNSTVLQIAQDVGYKAWTLASKDQSGFKNLPGTEPQQIKRIGASKYFQFKGRRFGLADGQYFLSVVERHKGSLFYKLAGRLMLIKAVVQNKFGLCLP